MTTNITLIGYKSSGKTTIAKLYAEQHSWTYIDTDNVILENNQAHSIYELYKTLGDAQFREQEIGCIANMINKVSNKNQIIIASGGGVILAKKNIINLKKISKIIYLDTPLETIMARLKAAPAQSFLTDRSAIMGTTLEHTVTENYNQRKLLYRAASDYIINTDEKTSSEIIAEIHWCTTNKYYSETC